jgi:competence protein ComEC
MEYKRNSGSKEQQMKTIKVLLSLTLVIILALLPGCEFLPVEETSPTPVAPLSSLEVTFLDLGQADAILIRTGNSTMLIDAATNSNADKLVGLLQERGIDRIDVLVGTHPHEDHIGGMDNVIKNFDIGDIYMPEISATTKTFEDVINAIQEKGLEITVPEPGSNFSLGSATCTILAPNSENYSDTNSYSIVIRLVYGNNSFLFTGDAETDSEEEMLAEGYTLRSDVLKVGHHGSTTSTSDEFLQAVSPEYAVIMVEDGNSYGHPHDEILDALNSAGIKIYRTDLNGTITFTSDGSNLAVSTEE